MNSSLGDNFVAADNTADKQAENIAENDAEATSENIHHSQPVFYVLHGWSLRPDVKQKWQPLINKLTAAGYQVEFLKLPGLQTELEEVWQLEDYRSWLLDQIENKESVVLVGHSFGGQLAAFTAAQQPQNLKKLILIGPAGKIDRSVLKMIKRFIFKIAAKAGRLILGKGKLAALGQRYLYKAAREKDYYQASANLKKTMVNVISTEIIDQLARIQVPVLIIWGKQDKYTPFKHAQIFHQEIKQSRLEPIKQAGHSPHYYQPDLIGDEILRFVEE